MSNMTAAMLALAVLFYAASILFGVGVASYFLDKHIKDVLVKYAFAFPIGFGVAPFLVVVQDAIAGGFSDLFMASAAVIMLIAFLVLYMKSSGAKMYDLRLLKKQILAEKWFHFIMFAIVAFFIVLQITGVYQSHYGIVGGDNYGTDSLFHLSIGNSLIYTGWPPKLLYADYARNVFPFITDFYTSMLSFNGVPFVYSLYMMNLPLYFSITFCTVYLLTLITKRRTAAAFGLFSFVFASLGLTMIMVYLLHISLPLLPYSQVQSMAHSPVSLLTYTYFNFSDPMESNFAPQHDYLLGWPLAMLILSVLYSKFLNKGSRGTSASHAWPDRPLLLAAAMTGLLPLIHPFSLIFVFVFALFAFVYSMVDRQRVLIFVRQWLPFGVVVFALALPQLFYIRSGSLAPQFASQVINLPYWSSSSVLESLLLHIAFWPETMGALLFVGLAGMYLLRKKWIVFVPAFVALALVNVVRFSPGFGDSNKITMYFLLFMAAGATELYYVLWKRGMAFRALAAFLFIAIVFSGVMAEYYDFAQGGYPIASNVELNMSAWMLSNIPQSATVADSCYNSVFGITSSVAARKTLMEISMYISLTGISDYNVGTVDLESQQFLLHPGCGFIDVYNVSYVAIENFSNFAPVWCDSVNRTAFADSGSFQQVKTFGTPNNNVTIYKALCGG